MHSGEAGNKNCHPSFHRKSKCNVHQCLRLIVNLSQSIKFIVLEIYVLSKLEQNSVYYERFLIFGSGVVLSTNEFVIGEYKS